MKLLREPLVQFLLIGAILFAVGRVRSGGGASGEIVVSAGKVTQLSQRFETVWMRPPTRPELEGLVGEYVREEVFYREARAMGLDVDDPVIRRRLMTKLQFVSEDLVTTAEPSDSDLAAWLAANPDKVRRDPILTFAQVYVATDRRGTEAAQAESARLLSLLRSRGPDAPADQLGDRTMLEHEFTRMERRDVALKFGDGFAATLDSIPAGTWSGPVESGYGLHLVLIRERVPGAVPLLAEVRDVVLREVQHEQRVKGVEQLYQQMREKYDVSVQWPGAGK
jgi:hypothetical protein